MPLSASRCFRPQLAVISHIRFAAPSFSERAIFPRRKARRVSRSTSGVPQGPPAIYLILSVPHRSCPCRRFSMAASLSHTLDNPNLGHV